MKSVCALLAVGAVLAAPVGVVPAAEARARPHVARQLAATRQLRVQLRKTRVLLARARADASRLSATLATTTSTLTQTQAQLATAQGQLATTQGQLATAQASAASLQARLDAIPSPLTVAEEQVRREVAWAEDGPTAAGVPYSHGQFVALSAMNYVVGHVSTGAYGYLLLTAGVLPTSESNSILGLQAGICGHAAAAFAAIVQHFGYPVRSVEFYFTATNGLPDNHIADEVFYDGDWHFFDPTFGLYSTDSNGNVLTITDVRTGAGTAHKDSASFTNIVEDTWFAGDDTAFETDPATSVLLGRQSF